MWMTRRLAMYVREMTGTAGFCLLYVHLATKRGSLIGYVWQEMRRSACMVSCFTEVGDRCVLAS